MNNNYISYQGSIFFFDDAHDTPRVPLGGAVFRRPNGRHWASTPQIIGEYSTVEPVEELFDEYN